MIDPRRIAPTHADLFIERYERLRGWALQLTERDQERAEDLLHDAFIQFTLCHPDLQSIRDLDSYLFVALRNLHLSQMRRATRTTARELSIVEYDSAELGLWAVDARDQIKTQDELRTVCHYACMRKKTAKAGSVLILRFFHGYYPEEVARVLRISRPAVKDRLRQARAEARLYLVDSDRLNLMYSDGAVEHPRADVGRISSDLLRELRQMIFDSREGDCFSSDELKELYSSDNEKGLGSSVVAHLVSCAKCLDEVNKLLGLPLLSERYATDMTGKDTRKKGGPGGGFSGRGGSGVKASLSRYLSRAQQVYRHEPKELCIAVNGYLQGTQKINSEHSELTLVIDMAEQIGFVEVFSELGIRLLLLNVDPMPAGATRQEARVELSEGRTLDATLSFGGAWPMLHVAYHNPLTVGAEAVESGVRLETGTLRGASPAGEIDPGVGLTRRVNGWAEEQSGAPASPDWPSRFRAWLRDGLRGPDWKLLLRPGFVTAIFAVLLTAALLIVWRSKPAVPLTAADLLQRASRAEEAAMSRPDAVIHRTLQIEERRGSVDGEILKRQRVEIWQSAARNVTARRLYDDRGTLVAGEWTRSDNVSTLYHHGTKPRLQIHNPQSAIRNLDDVWQLSLSAEEFSTLFGSDAARVEERPNEYVISLENSASSARTSLPSAVKSATLILGRDDLHAVEQTLVVEGDGEVRAYRIRETSFERRPLNAVAPAVFEPETELLGELELKKKGEAARSANVLTPSSQPSAPAILATPELEVEVLRLLNTAGGDLSDQVSVTRTPDGRLRVEGTVETARRKTEIVRALASVSKHPAVSIAVETVAEAEQRQTAAAKGSSGTIELQQVEIATTKLPVESELRRYFAGRGLSPDQLDQEMSRFANRVMHRSLQMRLYARILKQTLNRFSSDDLRALTPEARQKLMALIREQAGNLQREASTLGNELQPIVPGAATVSGAEPFETATDAELLRAVNRLGELVAQTDEGVRVSFSVSSERTGSAPVKDAQFWRALKNVESLAAKIGKNQ